MQIKRMLIANRGEIAVRIIKTAQKLGIQTYVIKAHNDTNAMYLNMADVICEIPEDKNFLSEFLDIEGIIKVAKDNKIQAIHPGYGFLSENPDFAKRCQEEKIILLQR